MEHVHDPESTGLSGMAVVATAIGLGAFGTLAVGRWRSGAWPLVASLPAMSIEIGRDRKTHSFTSAMKHDDPMKHDDKAQPELAVYVVKVRCAGSHRRLRGVCPTISSRRESC